MDVNTLVSALAVGASFAGPHAASLGGIVGTEVVKEATKDGYRSLKDAIGHVFGAKGRRAVDRLEADPASEQAQGGMAGIVADAAAEDLLEVDDKLQRFLAALRDDGGAIAAGEAVASIKLDIDSGGNVGIRRVSGVRTIDVKSRSEGDFDLSDVDMSVGGKSPGN